METSYHWAEESVKAAVQWLQLGIETCGAIVIALGMLATAYTLGRAVLSGQKAGFNAIRLQFARYLALALEFQLAADILSTAIAPGWDEIQKLAAIAVIRTGLNFFLMHEMKDEEQRDRHGEVLAGTTPD